MSLQLLPIFFLVIYETNKFSLSMDSKIFIIMCNHCRRRREEKAHIEFFLDNIITYVASAIKKKKRRNQTCTYLYFKICMLYTIYVLYLIQKLTIS